MSALAAIALGLAAVAYAVWPALRMRQAPALADDLPPSDRAVEAEAARLRDWSLQAGELEAADGAGEPAAPEA